MQEGWCRWSQVAQLDQPCHTDSWSPAPRRTFIIILSFFLAPNGGVATVKRPPQTRNRRQLKSGGGFGLLSDSMQHFLTFDNFSFPACNLALAQSYPIHIFSSPSYPPSLSLWRMSPLDEMLPCPHGPDTGVSRENPVHNSLSGSEVERCAVIVGWEVGLACKSEGSPVTALITLIRSIWSLYHRTPPWYIPQNWDNSVWMGKYKVECSNAAWPKLHKI